MRPTWRKTSCGIKLWQADCFAVFPSLSEHSVDLILADLPYGTTACAWDQQRFPLDLLWKEYARVMKPSAAVILTAAQPFAWQLCASKPEWFRYEIIWEKPNGTCPMLVHQQPFRVHENILVFYARQPTYHSQKTYGHARSSAFEDATKTIGEAYSGSAQGSRLISRHRANVDGSRYPRSVQRFEQDRSGHPTKKPVALMRWLIRSYSNPGDVVMDNTMGEGTTGVACVHEQRQFLGIEKDATYYDSAKAHIRAALSQLPLVKEE